MAIAPREMTVQPTPALVGSPSVGPAPVQAPQRQYVPFRVGTLERAEIVSQDTWLIGAAEQQILKIIEGSGYIYGLDLQYQAVVPSTNSATVTYVEDAPYSAASSVILEDVTGLIVNVGGFSLEMANRYGRWKAYVEDNLSRANGGSGASGSGDTSIFAMTTGSGATGGNFNFHIKVPVALNRRSLLAILGNQDRSQKYDIRDNLSASTAVYGTGPTALPNVTITRMYESYAVPNAVNDAGVPNQTVPSTYGVLHFLTEAISESSPVGGSTVNHYLRRLGNTARLLILQLRANGSRSTAETNLPTSAIQFVIGNQPLFNESVSFRRELMFNRYGFDAPNGILVYDFLHDFGISAGAELGHDWLWTQNVLNAQFQIPYPSGFGSTNNTLKVVTADMIIPANAPVYGQ